MGAPHSGPAGLQPSALPGGSPPRPVSDPFAPTPYAEQTAPIPMPQELGGAPRFQLPNEIQTSERPLRDRNALIDEMRRGSGLLPTPIMFLAGVLFGDLLVSWFMHAHWLVLVAKTAMVFGFFFRIELVGKAIWFGVIWNLAIGVLLLTTGGALGLVDDPRFVIGGIDVRAIIGLAGGVLFVFALAQTWALTRTETIRWFRREFDDQLIRAGG